MANTGWVIIDGVLNFLNSIKIQGKITTYNNITTAGNGVPSIVAAGRAAAQTAAVASVCTFTPASDATFELMSNVNVTVSTTHTFNVVTNYTDEANQARTGIQMFVLNGGSLVANPAIKNGNGTNVYQGVPMVIRAKGGTSITMTTAGTDFTTVTYNVDGQILQLA